MVAAATAERPASATGLRADGRASPTAPHRGTAPTGTSAAPARRRASASSASAAPELLPHRLEPVARAERDGAPALLGQQCRTRPPRRRRPRPRRRRRGRRRGPSRRVRVHPAQHRVRRAGSTPPTTATISPPPPCLGQPAGVECGPGAVAARRPAPRAAGAVLRSASRKCQALAGSSPAAVTSRTVKPRWLRWTAIEAAAETAASSEEAMPWPRWATHPVVEEQRRPRLPRLLLAAHHQLADPGRAAPVHPAQVVAAAVLAHGDVLGAAGGEGARPVVAGPGPGAAERDRWAAARCAG